MGAYLLIRFQLDNHKSELSRIRNIVSHDFDLGLLLRSIMGDEDETTYFKINGFKLEAKNPLNFRNLQETREAWQDY